MNIFKTLSLIALALVAVVIALCSEGPEAVAVLFSAGFAMAASGLRVKDELLKVSIALPNGAAAVQTPTLDLQNSPNGDFLARTELLIEAPLLDTADLPDTETMTYDVQTDADPAFGSPTTLCAGALVQTGAGGVGAAAAETKFALPTAVEKFIRVQATNSGAGDASDKTLNARLVF